MKVFGKNLSSLALGLSTLVFASAQGGSFDLEMTGPEYLKYLEANKNVGRRANAALSNILVIGKRNLDWFKLINANRPADQQLALYSPALQNGIPIEKPKEYNEATVIADYDALVAQLPEEYKRVVLAAGELPTSHALPTDTEYLEWTRKMDRAYQSASRWLIMEPNLWALAARSYGDIRGYYFLDRVRDLAAQLQAWSSLPEATRTEYYAWLTLLCHNSNLEKDACRTQLDGALAANTVQNFYNRYLPASKKRYDAYFAIQNPRRDVTWNANDPFLTLVPFLRPQSLEVQKWLADNIEDEWRFKLSDTDEWKLKLNFTEVDQGTTYVVFDAGATPHVNGLGGNQITMDANAPLQDYGSTWTIRHEYGHTLGLPDCYIEFYDTDREIIINYQIDLDNIMCSRKGHIQDKHYRELKAKYYQ